MPKVGAMPKSPDKYWNEVATRHSKVMEKEFPSVNPKPVKAKEKDKEKPVKEAYWLTTRG